MREEPLTLRRVTPTRSASVDNIALLEPFSFRVGDAVPREAHRDHLFRFGPAGTCGIALPSPRLSRTFKNMIIYIVKYHTSTLRVTFSSSALPF